MLIQAHARLNSSGSVNGGQAYDQEMQDLGEWEYFVVGSLNRNYYMLYQRANGDEFKMFHNKQDWWRPD